MLLASDIAAISGVAFVDVDGDDTVDVGEARLRNVEVSLYLDDVVQNGRFDLGETFVGNVITGPDGVYRFANLDGDDNDASAGSGIRTDDGFYVLTFTPGTGGVQDQTGAAFNGVVLSDDVSVHLTQDDGELVQVIDSFTTSQPNQPITATPFGSTTSSSGNLGTESGVIGNERDVAISVGGQFNADASVSVSTGSFLNQLSLFSNPSTSASVLVQYDGVDDDTAGLTLNPTGLRNGTAAGIDLSDGDTASGLTLAFVADQFVPDGLLVTVYTDSANFSTAAISLSDSGPGQDVFVPFSDFFRSGVNGADFRNVGAIEMRVNDALASSGLDFELSRLESLQSDEYVTTAPATVSQNVTPAELTVTNTVDIATAQPGSQLTYALTVSNTGQSAAENVIVTNDLPAGVTFVSGTGPSGALSPNGQQVVANAGTLAEGEIATFTILVTVDTGVFSDLINTVNVTTTTPETGGGTGQQPNTAIATTTISLADLSVLLAADRATLPPGSQVTYTAVVSNAGPTASEGVTLDVGVSAGVTIVDVVLPNGSSTFNTATGLWNVGTLAAGASVQLTIVGRVDTAGFFSTTVEILSSSTDPDSTPFNGEPSEDDQASLTVQAIAPPEGIPADNLGAISGVAFVDANGNGTVDVGETRLRNVQVSLFLDDNSNGAHETFETLVATLTTEADGVYRFTNLDGEDDDTPPFPTIATDDGLYILRFGPGAGGVQDPAGVVLDGVVLSGDVGVQVTQDDGELQQVIDRFTTMQVGQPVTQSVPGITVSSGGNLGAFGGVIGNERDIAVEVTSSSGAFASLSVNTGANQLLLETLTGVDASFRVQYDGVDADSNALSLNPVGLRDSGATGIDLSDGDSASGLMLAVRAGNPIADGLLLRVYTDAANFSTSRIAFAGDSTVQNVFVPFSSFVVSAGTGADFRDVGAIEIVLDESGSASLDFELGFLASRRSDEYITAATATIAAPAGQFDITIDKYVVGSTTFAPGDRVTFTIDVAHDLNDDGVEADNGFSPDVGRNIVITDVLPSGLEYESLTLDGTNIPTATIGNSLVFPAFDLQSGDFRRYQLTALVLPNTLGTLLNNASLTTGPGETDTTSNNSASFSIQIDPAVVTPQGGAIIGHKFMDFNGNGSEDAVDHRMNGWTFVLTDELGNTVIDLDGNIVEPFQTTDVDLNGDATISLGERGIYAFTNLRPGNYLVREVDQPDYVRTSRNPDVIRITSDVVYVARLDQAELVRPDLVGVFADLDLSFGNQLRGVPRGGAIIGHHFVDLNGDGSEDAGEPRLGGWSIILTDALGNPVFDLDGNLVEPFQTTDIDLNGDSLITDGEQGIYAFTNLNPGNYLVRAERQPGFEQTSRDPDSISIIGDLIYVARLDQAALIRPDLRAVYPEADLSFGNLVRGEPVPPVSSALSESLQPAQSEPSMDTAEAKVTLELVSPSENATSSLRVGEVFYVQVFAEDRRALPRGFGVLEAYANIGFDDTLIRRAMELPIMYGPGFDAANSGTRSSGYLANLGAARSLILPTNESRSLIATIPMRAIASGTLSVSAGPTLVGGDQFKLIDGDRERSAADVHYESIQISISPGDGSAQGESLDVNSDGVVSASDALYVINELNLIQTEVVDPIIHLNDRSRYDVNGDLKVTALDALMIINYLNQETLPPASESPHFDFVIKDFYSDDDEIAARDLAMSELF